MKTLNLSSKQRNIKDSYFFILQKIETVNSLDATGQETKRRRSMIIELLDYSSINLELSTFNHQRVSFRPRKKASRPERTTINLEPSTFNHQL